MILCSCNVLSERDVRKGLAGCACRPSVGALFRKMGCEAKCGRCTRNIVAAVDRHQAAGLKPCEGDDAYAACASEEIAA